MADSFQCMTKPTTIKKKNKIKKWYVKLNELGKINLYESNILNVDV